MKVFADLWWSKDVRAYGAPVRFNIHTKKWFYMVGTRSQRINKDGTYWGETVWRHVTRHPERPEIWRTVKDKRSDWLGLRG